VEALPNTWGTIDRTWKSGDTVSIRFPFGLAFRAVDRKNSDIAALTCGPLVLVTDEMTELIGDPDTVEDWIFPVDGKNLTFETAQGRVAGYDFLTRVFEPYHRIGAMRWYFMYNRIRKA